MRQKEFLSDALQIDTKETPVLAVVGGGGKTSLIFRLTEEFVKSGKKVLIATTTHMAFEPEYPFAENGEIIQIKKNLRAYGYSVTASLDMEKGKIGRLPQERLMQLKKYADVLMIEADGAKRLPLKVPEKWEPVIPDFADLVIGVIGMDAIGQPINMSCHRKECAATFLEKRVTDLVREQDVTCIALSEYGLRKAVDDRQYRVFLNKTDLPGKSYVAEKIAEELKKQKVLTAYGSLQRREYYR